MADTEQKLLLVLKGRDDGTAALLDKTGKQIDTLGQKLKDVGRISGSGIFGRMGDVAGASNASRTIRDSAETLRTEAAGNLYGVYKSINKELDAGNVNEERAAKLLQMKIGAADEYRRTLASINKSEADALKGTGGVLGKGAVVLGGMAIAGAIGKEMSKMADGIDRATMTLENFDGSYKDVSAELARSVPFLGNVVRGFDDLRESTDGFLGALAEESKLVGAMVDGTNRMRLALKDLTGGYIDLGKIKKEVPIADIYAEAAKVDQGIKAQNERRSKVFGMGDDVGGKNTAEQDITARRDKELAFIADVRKRSEINDEQAEAARVAVIQKADTELTRIRDDEARKRVSSAKKESDETLKIYRETGAMQVELLTSDADGKLRKLRADTAEQLAEIQQRIAEVRADDSLDPATREGRIGALGHQAERIGINAGINEKVIIGQGRRTAAEELAKLRIVSLQNEAALGNKAAEIEAKRLVIGEKYREQREEIARLERDSLLTADQRAELEKRKKELGSQEQKELGRVGRGEMPSGSWLDEAKDDPKILDSRGQGNYLEGLRKRNAEKWSAYGASGGGNDASSKTAASTAEIAKASSRQNELLAQMLDVMKNQAFAILD